MSLDGVAEAAPKCGCVIVPGEVLKPRPEDAALEPRYKPVRYALEIRYCPLHGAAERLAEYAERVVARYGPLCDEYQRAEGGVPTEILYFAETGRALLKEIGR